MHKDINKTVVISPPYIPKNKHCFRLVSNSSYEYSDSTTIIQGIYYKTEDSFTFIGVDIGTYTVTRNNICPPFYFNKHPKLLTFHMKLRTRQLTKMNRQGKWYNTGFGLELYCPEPVYSDGNSLGSICVVKVDSD